MSKNENDQIPKLKEKGFFIIKFIVILLIFSFVHLYIHFSHRLRSMKREIDKTNKGQLVSLEERIRSLDRHLSFLQKELLPIELEKIAYAEDAGVVLGVKKVSINSVDAPYNASIIKNANGYSLLFRHDVFHDVDHLNNLSSFYTVIGGVKLNENFKQITPYVPLNTQSLYSEDPRVVKAGNDFFVVYNDLFPHQTYCRTMKIAKIDIDTFEVEYITDLDQHINLIEKNWVPFEYINPQKNIELHFIYNMNPHKVLRLKDPAINNINHLTFPKNPTLNASLWPKKWGTPRGGTPALLVDGQYLSFFHSGFKDLNNTVWYVMGAYTFERDPPFKITSISKCPILFNGIYDTKHINTANPQTRVIYPSGFVLAKEKGKDVIHLSCGENDCAIKIITLDKNALLKSLKKINQQNAILNESNKPI